MDIPVKFDGNLLKDLDGLLGNPSYNALRLLVMEIDLGIWDVMLKVASGLEFIFQFADRFYEAICKALGFCPKLA